MYTFTTEGNVSKITVQLMANVKSGLWNLTMGNHTGFRMKTLQHSLCTNLTQDIEQTTSLSILVHHVSYTNTVLYYYRP